MWTDADSGWRASADTSGSAISIGFRAFVLLEAVQHEWGRGKHIEFHAEPALELRASAPYALAVDDTASHAVVMYIANHPLR